MAKDGNGTTRWITQGLFAIIIVVLAPLLHEVIQGAKANAAQDATISAITETNKRIEAKVDRILALIMHVKPQSLECGQYGTPFGDKFIAIDVGAAGASVALTVDGGWT